MKNSIKGTSIAILMGFLLGAASLLPAQKMVEAGTINFDIDAQGNPLPAGMVLNEQYAAWGVHISAVNNRRNHPSEALVFDSSHPSGGDTDLGTPNQAFGGPGKGEGGSSIQGKNDKSLGNLVIIAENMDDNDGDGMVDDPDDEAGGGQLIFKFDQQVTITELVLVDIDENERGAIIVATSGDKNGMEIPLKGLGDNSVVHFENANWTGIDRFEIRFPGSGGVASLSFEPAQN